jgi:hypothetical protein
MLVSVVEDKMTDPNPTCFRAAFDVKNALNAMN